MSYNVFKNYWKKHHCICTSLVYLNAAFLSGKFKLLVARCCLLFIEEEKKDEKSANWDKYGISSFWYT